MIKDTKEKLYLNCMTNGDECLFSIPVEKDVDLYKLEERVTNNNQLIDYCITSDQSKGITLKKY